MQAQQYGNNEDGYGYKAIGGVGRERFVKATRLQGDRRGRQGLIGFSRLQGDKATRRQEG